MDLQEYLRNATYILGPYMGGFENTAKDEDFWNGSDSGIYDSIEVGSDVFGQWLMNAKSIQVTRTLDSLVCDEDTCTVQTDSQTRFYDRIFNLSGPIIGAQVNDPYNFIFSQGPANFTLNGDQGSSTGYWAFETGSADDETADVYWGLFSRYNWYGVYEGDVDFSPVPYISCIHKYGRFFFNWHVNDAQLALEFKSVGLSQIYLEQISYIGGYQLKETMTISMSSTFF
jgi:hypothetical protein